MGQRLVVTIHCNGDDIAKIYYHWSAYSLLALEEARDIINSLPDEPMSTRDLILHLIRLCESHGGSISGGEGSPEWKYITELYPNETFKPDPNRVCGLIGISKAEMKNIQDWSEGDITIDIDSGMVYNTVYYRYETIDEYRSEMGIEDDKMPNIPQIDFDLSAIPFSDIEHAIDSLPENVCCDKSGDILQLFY